MRVRFKVRFLALILMVFVVSPALAQRFGGVTAEALLKAEENPADWLSYGRDYAETHYSPLDHINARNVSRLEPAWTFNPETALSFESTPLVADGVLYGSGAWSVIFAVNAKTGAFKWRWDPEIPRDFISHVCCGPDTRGLALYDGRVYVGVLDGRLAALDQATGKKLWEVQTTDPNQHYSISSPPRIVKGKVIVGNAGSEFGVRGYVSAFDAETGKMLWRFYTVPGDPSKPFEHPELEMAAKTWTGEWWVHGGGGTVWDGMAYDPEADLVYVGTGNGAVWNRDIRSPGGGDNLFLASILALDPDTGRMAWYYQTTPGDTWDFTATQNLILADLEIGGRERKVIMQAPKNGFFYVLDRLTGEFISAKAFTPVNWATGIDPKTGRPMETLNARYKDAPILLSAGGGGAHNWEPMSFNPKTGLVYIPGRNRPFPFGQDPDFEFVPGRQNFGVKFDRPEGAPLPDSPPGYLLAWDPVKQEERWRVPYAPRGGGGTLTTGGNLVFQGTQTGAFIAYDAETGDKLWEAQTAEPGIATPITYELDGVQYVSILAGRNETGRLFTFRLNEVGPQRHQGNGGPRESPLVGAERPAKYIPRLSKRGRLSVSTGR